ncbi:MAG: hypothetical protein KGO83_02595 [Paenibacillaceae bacterium]|nr:hypothetical protein [Paenibacillaceae bacterium]
MQSCPNAGVLHSVCVDLEQMFADLAVHHRPTVLHRVHEHLLFVCYRRSGVEAQVRPRSVLVLRYGITTLNAPGTIDADYRGEVCVLRINLGAEYVVIKRGMRIAQLVFQHVPSIDVALVDELPQTTRSLGALGIREHKGQLPQLQNAQTTTILFVFYTRLHRSDTIPFVVYENRTKYFLEHE